MIMKDFNFPLLWKYPTSATDGKTLEIRFKLPVRTNPESSATAWGITYGQFIGVRFQTGLFAFSSSPVRCALSSATDSYTVDYMAQDTGPITQTQIDDNIAYCQFLDKTHTRLPGDTTLTLTLTFADDKEIAAGWIHNISIFTATTNNPDQIIIDNLPSLGTVGLYRNYKLDDNNKIIVVSNGGGGRLASITSPSNHVSNVALYPGFTIDIKIAFEMKQYWALDPNDYIFYVKYSLTSFTYPTSITTEKFSDSLNENKLPENLTHTEMTDGILVNGILQSSLYPRRKFRLVLKGVETLYDNLDTSTSVDLYVFYKNTYSIVSYSSTTMDTVSKIVLQGASAHHPEYFPVFDGMGWPFQFDFRSDIEIKTGGWVVIRQRGYNKVSSSVVLVASTCDFSANNVEQNFGQRWNCHPLRNDFKYDTTTGTTYVEGNGIYFKLPTLVSSTSELTSVKVWGFIDKCLGATAATNYSADLAFTIRIFKSVSQNDTYMNEKIFFDLSQNSIIAFSDNVIFSTKCYPLQTRSETIAGTMYDTTLSKIPPIRQTTDHNYPVGIEINNLYLTVPSSSVSIAKPMTNKPWIYGGDGDDNFDVTNFPHKYIFSSNSDLQTNDLLFYGIFRTQSVSNGCNYNLIDYFPTECRNTTTQKYLTSLTDPRIQWLFSRQWFSIGSAIDSTAGCQVSWHLVDDLGSTTESAARTLKFTDGVLAGTDSHLTTITSKALSATTPNAATRSANMNVTTSNINVSTSATGAALTNQIISNIFNLTDDQVVTLSMSGHGCDAKLTPNKLGGSDAALIGVYTDCLKWSSKPSSVSWLYTYFDVMQMLMHNTVHPSRLIRYIKLYPELGVFQDPSLTDSTSVAYTDSTKEKWATSYYEVTTASSTPFAVCLIELSAKFINGFKPNSSDTLVIFLFGASLLDTDVTEASSQYPAAPLSSAKAYGYNSGQTMSMGFRRIGDPANLASSTSYKVYPDISGTNAGEEMSELEMYFYKTVAQTSYTDNTAQTPQAFQVATGFPQKRTLYHFFLGSLIVIPSGANPTGDDSKINLYIPFLCPTPSDYTYSATSPAYPANGVYWVTPIITVGWAQATANNNWSKFDNYISPSTTGQTIDNHKGHITLPKKFANASAAGAPIQFPLYKSPSKTGVTIWTSNPRVKSISQRDTNLNYLKVQFKPYTLTTNGDDKKFLINNTSANSKSTSSITILINSTFEALSTAVVGNPDISSNLNSTFRVSTVENSFYVVGKPFNRFLAWSYTAVDGVMNANNPLTASDVITNATFSISTTYTIEVSGIPRLPISTFNSSGTISALNYIGVFTQRNVMDVGATANGISTNLRFIDTTGTSASFKDFILWHPQTVYNTWNAVLSLDSVDNSISSDKGGNIRVTGTYPTEIPQGSQLKITVSGSVLLSTTVCGLVENTVSEIATTCSVSGTVLTCTTTKLSTEFDVCCYNISNDNTSITATVGNVVLPYNTTYMSVTAILVADYPNTIYTDPENTTTNNLDSITFTNRTVTDIGDSASTFYSKLNNLVYSHSSTHMGYGKAHLEVVLPRSATRGMILTVAADFSKMKTLNLETRVIPTFGNSQLMGGNLDEGDFFLDTLYSNFSGSGIEIRLRNIIYKCRLSLSNTLHIYLWPIQTYNYSELPVAISMKTPDGTDLANNDSHTVTSTPNLTGTLTRDTVYTDFCKIASVEPKLPDAYAEYTIEFSYNQFSTDLETKDPNEYIIVLPYMYYGDMPEVLCYDENNLLQCNFIDRSILSIRYDKINTNGDSAQVVRLVGLRNPYLGASNGIYWGCGVAETDFTLNTRNYLVRGTMTYNEGNIPAAEAVFGNIIFKNGLSKHTIRLPQSASETSSAGQAQGAEPLNPREDPPKLNSSWETLHQFGFTIDIANNQISSWDSGYTFDTDPVLYITFPKDYKFHWYTFKPTAEIECYRINEIDFKITELFDHPDATNTTSSNTGLQISSVTVVGNQLRLTFNKTKIEFTKFFQYFILKIYEIPPPVDNTSVIIDGRITTEAFEFSLMNSKRDKVFKTWNNLNNWSMENILVNRIDFLLPQNKGFKYEFDQKKWVIDAYDKVNNKINMMVVRTGRYMTYYWKVRTSNRLLSPQMTQIELIDTKFSLAKPYYDVATYLFSEIPFRIGVECKEIPGYLISRPNIINSQNSKFYTYFMPLSPIQVEVKTDLKGVILYTKDNIVRINGSLFLDFTVAEAPFEDITINFTAAASSEIENTKIAIGEVMVRTVFRMTDKVTTDLQSYNVPTLTNNCYQFQHDKINFTVDGVAAIIPNDALTSDMFEYRSNDLDNTVAPNSVNFVFTTEYSQIYFYAVLTCINDEFPTDENMKRQNVTQTSRLRYYSEILNIQQSTTITFNNLLRGIPYKLKVVIESTQGNITERTGSLVVKTNHTLTNGTNLEIKASDPFRPICASYRFASRPGVQVTDPLLWYWQKKFAITGYYESGCVSAVDQYGTELPGLPSIKNETNCGVTNCRFVQRQTFDDNSTQLDVPETYSICAYPINSCANNPLSYQERFNELMVELSTNTTFNQTLNTRVVPDFNLTVIDDNIVPKGPEVVFFEIKGRNIRYAAKSETPIMCFTKASKDAAPALSDFDVCDGECYGININSEPTDIIYQLPEFTVGGTYSLYAVCSNDMPCSRSRTSVLTLGTETISGSDSGTGNGTTGNGTTGNGTTGNGTTGNGTNGSGVNWISLNLIALIMMLLVLLN
eukprot:CAMPEP_0170518016 /NCGR_PEP_ID=MMETSP0209-20121228/3809_1 /TAXON_ID=665100 ORGANISM="Litonotus pictus, Strain P1" /NCGR_SAMPLE_ID=MMETSP0209 /ASSEMBLY_ACC=CAM_ASM_000301 /LENGTH=2711 /DNA_ID=CAMNT_0010803431 /DNA_START=59 /DNA_END=8194 /DNA_ORIENTATION=+